MKLLIHSSNYCGCFYQADVVAEHEVAPITPKVLTGAGDSWNAGFLYSWIKSTDIDGSLKAANQFAKQYISGKLND